MNRFASEKLWPMTMKLAAQHSEKQAAIAYVASDANLAFGRGDVLITDASDAVIAGGQTSAKVLKAAHAKGAKLYSMRNLHAKVICVGRYLVVGSANASSSSANDLVEAGVVSDDPRLLAEARGFIAQLVEKATPINDNFLRRISSIKVVRSPRAASRKPKVKDRAARVWLVGVHEIDPDRYEDEGELVEQGTEAAKAQQTRDDSEISWLRILGNSRFRREATRGDTVIQISRASFRSKRPRVYGPAPILQRQDEGKKRTRFFVEAFGDSEERSMSWKAFQKHWKQVVRAGSPPMNCARLLNEDVADRLVAPWAD